MSDREGTPPPRLLPRNLVTVETFRRKPEDRPAHGTIAGIADWLIGPARMLPPGAQQVDEFAWRLLATGMPLLRVTFHSGTLHPQFLGVTHLWWRTTGETQSILIAHEVADAIPYEENPIRRVADGGETLRRRLETPDAILDFVILPELREKGATDYIALPVTSARPGRRYVVSYVTDRPGGFTDAEIATLCAVSERLSIPADMQAEHWIARNVLSAYLGSKTGPRVLAGHIRRAVGEEIAAVLWCSDLRGFTERSDRLPGSRMIAILDALFDAQATAIARHGGEILKFMGDGLLVIFPIEQASSAAAATADALNAAEEALVAVRQLADDPVLAGEPPLQIVIALHVGTVLYGNIGAADRLDFTVIGPAVNLVSRIEVIAKELGRTVVVSDDFARAYGGPLVSLGRHQLRGLAKPHELFAPEAGSGARSTGIPAPRARTSNG